MVIARHVRIRGRVQGVFFRAWARDEARAIGVAGWIRNCSDGSVEAQTEGDDDAVDNLIGLLGAGPPGARVDSIDVEESDAKGLSEFEVRH